MVFKIQVPENLSIILRTWERKKEKTTYFFSQRKKKITKELNWTAT